MKVKLLPILIVLVSIIAFACGEEDTQTTAGDNDFTEEQQPFDDPNSEGEYLVGAVHTTFAYTNKNRELPGTIWYPTRTTGNKFYYQVIIPRENVYDSVPVADDGKPYPLLVFSHGNGGVAEQSYTLMEYLARHGFIVAACDHVGNTAADWQDSEEGKRKVPQSVEDRPRDISTVIDRLLEWNEQEGHLLYGAIDTNRIAVAGHSLGGFTALMVAGAYLHFSEFKENCNPDESEICDLLTQYDTSMITDGQKKDNRVKACIAYTPAGYQFWRDEGLAMIDIPVLVYGGERDQTCPMDTEINPIYNALNPPKGLVVMHNAGHMSFTNMCDLVGGVDDYLRREGCAPDFLPPDECFKVMERYTLAFLRRFLFDDSRYDKYLSPDDPQTNNIPATVEFVWENSN